MKNLKFLGLCLFCFCACARVSAQLSAKDRDLNKPRLFSTLPDRIPIAIEEIKTLFAGKSETGREIRLEFTDRKLPGLNGRVVSSVSKYDDRIKTIIIRSSNFSGATLTLSSSTQPDGTVNYTGRIISFQHGDLLELEKQNEQYILVKKNFHDLISD
jgi:hypothetical protein